VSVNRQGQAPGTRCEIKNLNSIRFMIAAIGNSTSPSIFVITFKGPLSQGQRCIGKLVF
jgi:aspartyl-tRNA(Asn)/glutamyl-tRNA(Gln) amidotransferase subunit B